MTYLFEIQYSVHPSSKINSAVYSLLIFFKNFFYRAIAQNRNALKKMGITHVLNAAHSKQGSIGDQSYYGNTIVYYGIPAEDSSSFDLSVHFKSASDFIHKALRKKNGK